MTPEEFFRLLARRTRRTARRIDREIESRCTQTLAVLMCDASGFSRRTHEYGILQFLSVMTRCYEHLLPILRRRGGEVLSHGADNILAVYCDPVRAVRAALEVRRWLNSYNRGRPDSEQFYECAGIHYGPLLRAGDMVFGATVNVAAKIGEDLAGQGEILVTREVVERVPKSIRCVYDRTVTLGTKPFELFRVRG